MEHIYGKKELILVGNKPFLTDQLACEIDSYDFVVRVNRMNNLYLSGSRVDGYYLGMWKDFRNIWNGGPYKDRIKDARKVFMCQKVFENTDHVFEYVTKEQYDNCEIIDINASRAGIGAQYPTSTVSVLWHLLNTHWNDEYNITLTGLDIDGRGDMFLSESEWNTTKHGECGYDEERYLKWLVETRQIKFIDTP